MKPNGVDKEQVKLKAFPFSLKVEKTMIQINIPEGLGVNCAT